MAKVAILIPSHISYEGQIDLLDKCILSLIEQILKPKSIYISISFENDTYKTDFKSILHKYGRTTNPRLILKFQKKKNIKWNIYIIYLPILMLMIMIC